MAAGLLMFVLSPFVTVLGILDPNTKRGAALTLAALVAAPTGLLIAAF